MTGEATRRKLKLSLALCDALAEANLDRTFSHRMCAHAGYKAALREVLDELNRQLRRDASGYDPYNAAIEDAIDIVERKLRT